MKFTNKDLQIMIVSPCLLFYLNTEIRRNENWQKTKYIFIIALCIYMLFVYIFIIALCIYTVDSS